MRCGDGPGHTHSTAAPAPNPYAPLTVLAASSSSSAGAAALPSLDVALKYVREAVAYDAEATACKDTLNRFANFGKRGGNMTFSGNNAGNAGNAKLVLKNVKVRRG